MATFPFQSVDQSPSSLMPKLPLTLSLGNRSSDVIGLLDTGASVNVLPYFVGLELGAIWQEQTISVPLVGSLGKFQAKALIVLASHSTIVIEPVRLVFAWIESNDVPIIFGQTNFFLEFDVCFYRSQGIFEVNLTNR